MNATATLSIPDAPVLDEDPFSDANIADPYPLFDRMREMAPALSLIHI